MAGIIDLTEDNEMDDDLKQAIQMSLQQDVASDDADLKQAIATSLQESVKAEQSRSVQPVTEPSGLLGMDRKAMEAERLARLSRKRNAEAPSRSENVGQSISPPPLKRQRLEDPKSRKPSDPLSSNFRSPQVYLTSTPSRYNGDFLQAVSMHDILKPPSGNHSLTSVLASSFIIDFNWLLPHFNTKSTNFLFVLHASTPQHRQLLEQDFAGIPNVKLLTPPCSGGNMHSKLMLLFFKDSKNDHEILRLVVPSANLIAADWGVSNIMENICFVADLEKTQTGTQSHPFKQRLMQQLRAMEVPENVTTKLEAYDFESLQDTRFVFSMTSSEALEGSVQSTLTNKPSNPTRVGLVALYDEINSLALSLSKDEEIQLDFVTSSLGNLTPQFVQQLYDAAAGRLDPDEIARSSKSARNKLKTTTNDPNTSQLEKNIRIYFPSDSTVQNSKGGAHNAGTICFQRKWWDQNDLIRNCLHDCIGVRHDGILMHSKVSCSFLFSLLNSVPLMVWARILLSHDVHPANSRQLTPSVDSFPELVHLSLSISSANSSPMTEFDVPTIDAGKSKQ